VAASVACMLFLGLLFTTSFVETFARYMTMLPRSAVATAKSMYMSAARGRISTQFPIVASPLSSMPSLTIFDRVGKKRQRSRAATKPDWAEYEYLRAEVAKRLVDRLEDIMRDFPQALELGAYGPHIAQEVNAVKGLNGSKSRLRIVATLVKLWRVGMDAHMLSRTTPFYHQRAAPVESRRWSGAA